MGSVGVQRRFWKPRLRAFFLTSTKLTENAEATLRPYIPRAHGKLSMLSTLYNVGTAEFKINTAASRTSGWLPSPFHHLQAVIIFHILLLFQKRRPALALRSLQQGLGAEWSSRPWVYLPEFHATSPVSHHSHFTDERMRLKD